MGLGHARQEGAGGDHGLRSAPCHRCPPEHGSDGPARSSQGPSSTPALRPAARLCKAHGCFYGRPARGLEPRPEERAELRESSLGVPVLREPCQRGSSRRPARAPLAGAACFGVCCRVPNKCLPACLNLAPCCWGHVLRPPRPDSCSPRSDAADAFLVPTYPGWPHPATGPSPATAPATHCQVPAGRGDGMSALVLSPSPAARGTWLGATGGYAEAKGGGSELPSL